MSSFAVPESASRRRARDVEVADGVGVGDRVSRREVTAFATSAAGAPPRDALLEQADLARELGVLALEVGERLFGRRVGVLADLALAVRSAHEDGARLVDATPRLLL